MMMADWETMSDDEFLETLDNIDEYEPDAQEPGESTDDTVEDTDPVIEEPTAEAENTETEDQIDDEDQKTEFYDADEEEESQEENTQVEDEEAEKVDETETKDEAEDGSEKKETETEEKETEEVNYQEEYAKILDQKNQLQGFYDEITSEFVANGKTVKGFSDPKKIIQSQQMAAGFVDKMAGFKQYKPFISALKAKGVLDDPDKFNFAMQLLEGDQEALKQQMKNVELDPLEVDMENIDYQPRNQMPSKIEMAFDDLVDSAQSHGVDVQVKNVISSKEWDDDSVIELLEDTQNSTDLVNHISSGIYDVVLDRISEKKRADFSQVYSNKPMIEQYREAAGELETEYLTYNQQKQAYEDHQRNGAQQKQNEEYKQKVELENAKAAKARKRATSASRTKPKSKKPKQVFDPDELSDQQMTDILDGLISGN